jgi:bifunctional non-homologous end joining protein LigD
MALEEYKRKRNFRKTPEPAGAAAPHEKTSEGLSFVIQKHAARRLHYDFRLELDGVLKSWAVPKGPSLDPGEKRLAVHVEDHPLDYGQFEGVIPKGEYGGGTVLLWDRGTWIPVDPDPEAAYRKGSLKFALNGEKLHGKWALVRMGGKAASERRENWLLIKERDDEAMPKSGDAVVSENPLSVATGRSLDAIASERDWVWHSNKGEGDTSPAVTPRKDLANIAGARRGPMRKELKPQLATPVDKAPEGSEWLHEIKYDGYRLLARVEGGKVRLITRGGLDWTTKFPALARRLGELGFDSALIDGELVHLEPDGTTSFSELQDAISSGRTDTLNFFAFDLLYRDGWDLTGAALEDRKAALAEIVPPHAQGMLHYSDHQIDRGPDVLRQASRLGLEGIVSKRRTDPYRPGRNRSWLKVKCRNREEFVIVGFTDPDGSREGFGALLAGYYDPQGNLRYSGRVGTGFKAASLIELRHRLEALVRSDPPVALPKGVSRKGVHWVEPRLVAEVEFADWTADAIRRQASFQGLREDKDAREVVYDRQSRTAAALAAAPKKAAAQPKQAAPKDAGPMSLQRARDGSLMFEGVRLTHPDRVLYSGTTLTKLDIARYYTAVSEWALPELSRRVLTLVRSPAAGQKTFYQKHIDAGAPAAIKRLELDEEAGPEIYPYIEDLPGLIGLVQMGVLEIHPWGSRIEKLERPDRVTFDLDPDEDLPWQRVTEAAVDVRDALFDIGLRSFAKTTGGKGLHVVVPLTPKLDWDEVKAFAKWVADSFVTQRPEAFTANMAKKARQGRIFIDYLRNGRGATAVAAYSPRVRSGAPVSAPLSWEEVENGARPGGLTVETVPERMAKLAIEPWAEMTTIRQSITAAVRRRIGI